MQDKKKEIQKVLAKIVKQKRKSSISRICLEIGMSKSLWSVIEKGEKDVNLSTFWRIAEAFDIKPSVLLSDMEKELGEDFSFIED